jgi:hypothetical protein
MSGNLPEDDAVANLASVFEQVSIEKRGAPVEPNTAASTDDAQTSDVITYNIPTDTPINSVTTLYPGIPFSISNEAAL